MTTALMQWDTHSHTNKNEQMRYWAGICWSLITKIPECGLFTNIAFYYYEIATKSVWIAFHLLLTAFKLESKMKNNTHNYLHDQFFDDDSRANIRFTIKKVIFTHVHSPVRKFLDIIEYVWCLQWDFQNDQPLI